MRKSEGGRDPARNKTKNKVSFDLFAGSKEQNVGNNAIAKQQRKCKEKLQQFALASPMMKMKKEEFKIFFEQHVTICKNRL